MEKGLAQMNQLDKIVFLNIVRLSDPSFVGQTGHRTFALLVVSGGTIMYPTL